MFFRFFTVLFFFCFSNNVIAAQYSIPMGYKEPDIVWHVQAHKKINKFTSEDKSQNLNPSGRNIAFIRITINGQELDPNIAFYSGGQTPKEPGGEQRVNVFSYIPEESKSIGEWAEYIQKFLKEYTGIEPFLEHVKQGYVTHSEIAIFMYLMTNNLLQDGVIIDIASARDACKLKCVAFLNGLVKKHKIVIRFSGGMADQPGTARSTRDLNEQIGIRYQFYQEGKDTSYNSGDFT